MRRCYNHKLTEEKKNIHFKPIQIAISNMLNLLNDILVFGKVDAGELICQTAPIDLENFCRELIETLQATTSSQHQITFTYFGDCTKVELDESLCWHILTNLLSNAIKYTPTDGIIQFDLICQNNIAIIQIQDTGIGIPLPDQQHLFEPFYRCSNTSQIQGTGLGLSIVKKCVDLHKGQIEVESKEGVGTTFTVKIPF